MQQDISFRTGHMTPPVQSLSINTPLGNWGCESGQGAVRHVSSAMCQVTVDANQCRVGTRGLPIGSGCPINPVPGFWILHREWVDMFYAMPGYGGQITFRVL